MDFLLLLILCPLLMIAPGAWISFTLFDRNLGYMLRLALAIAFSPFVVGLQVLALSWLNVPFTIAAPLTLLNIFALRLMFPKRAAAIAPMPAPSTWAVMACTGVLTAVLIAAWMIEPGLRTYSWHNFMQINPIYEIARLPERLEEWDLAGYGIHFSWLGHIQIAVIAWLADTSPFYVHPVTNIGALFATIALLSATVVRFRPTAPVFSVFAATTAFLSTNLIGIVLSYFGDADWRIGETRLCSIFYKYFNVDLMTTGIALMCGAMLMAIMAAQERRRHGIYLACLCAAALACIYPFLFPLTFAAIGMAWVGPRLVQLLETKRLTLERGDGSAFLALVAALIVFALNIKLLGGDESIIAFSDPASVRTDLTFIFKAVGLWTPLLALSCYIVWKQRDVARGMLLICGAMAVVLYLLFRLPAADQYKFMFAGLLAMMPLAAAEAIGALQRLGRLAAPVGAAIAVCIVAIAAPHLWRDHLPWSGVAEAPALREDNFFVEPVAPELAWTMAVRERTPADTILFAPETRLPLSGYTARAAYIPVDFEPRSVRYGFLMTVSELADVKALRTAVLDQRTAIVRAAYRPNANYARIVTELARMHRPIAIVGAPNEPFIVWLRASRIGATIYQDEHAAVQLVSAGVTAVEGE